MRLSEKQIEDLLRSCQLTLEGAYAIHLTDEYFKRGFLLATTEITKLFMEVLKKYNVNNKENNM